MTLVLVVVLLLMILSSLILAASFILAGRAQRRIDSERMATRRLIEPSKLSVLSAIRQDDVHAPLQNDPDYRFAPGISSAMLAESIQVDDYKNRNEV